MPTSLDIREPGLNTLPLGVERHVVNGGGLTGVQIFPDDEIEIVNDEGNQICEILVFNKDGSKLFVSGNNDNTVDQYSLTSPFSLYNVSGESTGDVIDTSSTDNYDTDPDSDTLTVTAIRTGSSENNGTPGSVGSALDGTYGQLTLAANGSYTYVANKDAADALDPGDVVTDSFNYTVSDGQGETDIAVLTITVIGINDAPVGVADPGWNSYIG